VQAVLAARIDRLPPEDKRLLQTAAVIGTEVPLPLLHAIAELPEEVLQRGLTHLQAAEFLYETRLFPEREFTFKHALTHEVAYGSLLQERRRELHARIVNALEELAGNQVAQQVERLAHHALRAEVWGKTLAYFWQAGDKAMARSAHGEAVGYFEQALSALAHLPERSDTREQAIDLRLALRTALVLTGNSERLLACLREAEGLAEALDDARRLARVSIHLSHYFHMNTRMHDQANAVAQRALALAMASEDVVLQGMAHHHLGLVHWPRGDYRRAIGHCTQAVASFDGTQRHERFGGMLPPTVGSRVVLAWCHAELGTFAEGRALGEEGLRIAEEMEHPTSLVFAYAGIGWLALRQGNVPRALSLLERAVGLCQEADLPALFPGMAMSLGAAYILAERVTDAVSLVMQAFEQFTAMNILGQQTRCCLALGEAQMLVGRLEEAHTLAEQSLALAQAHQQRGTQAYALRLLGDIAARRDPLDSALAEAHYLQALALAEALEMRPLQAHCHRDLGTLYATGGQREQARAEFSAAIALYRAMDMTFWLPQAEAALAQVEK
jgi:tetratricopeptide (TPR) repeat protein